MADVRFISQLIDTLEAAYNNRFLECTLAASAEFILTVNTAPGHFDRKQYQAVSVIRPGKLPEVGRLVKMLIRD